jgi:hypothetical protein
MMDLFSWHWWAHSDAGLTARIAIGAAIFAALAWTDWRRNRRQAQRWREYLFLLGAVAAALAYGALNDQLTSRLSWEYFYYGKGLADILPPGAEHSAALHWEAAKIGMKATWTAGLIIGVVLLIANNPRRGRPQLSYSALAGSLGIVMAICILFAALLGVAGYLGWLIPFSSDFAQMVQHDEFRPYRFMAVFGVHLGGYLGGLIGMMLAVGWMLKQRRRRAYPPGKME